MIFLKTLTERRLKMGNAQLKKVLSESAPKENEKGKGETRIPDSYVENMTVQDMITEFPNLVRGGQYVNALAVIQGHGRFIWCYSLLEKVVTRLFCGKKKEKATAEKENVAVPPMLKEAKAK
jgi:hypothetical protein